MKVSIHRIAAFLTIAGISVANAFAVSPNIPVGYYTSLNGKSESELKTAVRNVIYNHTQVSSYSALPQYFQQTDIYPGTNRWWDMYSNIPLYAPSFSGLNREHSFPKSWWGGSTNIPAYTDLNHLYPSEIDANTAKSNYPLGKVASIGKGDFDNGVCKVGPAVAGQGGGAVRVFEPADEYKGDFARTYFYMVTCYQDLSWKYKYMLMDGIYPTLNQWAQTLLLQWHKQDGVSQKEIDRNEAVYAIQNNRNPFIDYPELADYIWGDKRGQPFSADIPDTPVGDALLIKPTQGMNLDFGQVATGKTATNRIQLLGENLTGALTLSMDRNSRNNFTISESEIAARLVNQKDGYWVEVTYNPTETGKHSGKFIMYDGGLKGSVTVTLNGECLEKPTLTKLTATAPSDITSTSYVANWEPAPETETVDYYVVTRIRIIRGQTVTEDLPAENTSLEINEFDKSDMEMYYVRSYRLGYMSAPSDMIMVHHSGVTGVETNRPLWAESCPGGLMVRTFEPHTGLKVIDMTGRTVRLIPSVDNGTTIELPSGIYLITTDQMHKPIKVAAGN